MSRKRPRTPKPSRRRPQDFARRFPENGLKLLLEDSFNVHDLLGLSRHRAIPPIDSTAMQAIGTTFVQRGYRHIECDVLLTAPYRGPGRSGGRRRILIWVLIEHQSEPDELMPLRVLEYVVQVYRYQERPWRREHGTSRGVRLDPVLPDGVGVS